MWANKAGILDAVLDFAAQNTNVILELKTKSNNITHLMNRQIPPNVIVSWSLNPQVIIDNEEHLTASLEQRIKAARKIADKGILTGFHFHPMVHYDDWQKDYGAIFNQLLTDFDSKEVVMISFGTLTFIKPLIKKIRQNTHKSRILQMPLVETEGKLSYPLEIKQELFNFAYSSFSPWHKKVFFYLCMENPVLWEQVFGHDYPDNNEFENDMFRFYKSKTDSIHTEKAVSI